MSTKAFWAKHSIKGTRNQPGNPTSKEEKKPSSHADISPEKAKKILEDGSVRGHPLTDKQKGFFGAIAGRGA